MKFYGKIGFAETVETSPCVYEEIITERYYKGDVVRNTEHLSADASVNFDVNISNDISIQGDDYIYQNLSRIRYIEFMGVKWVIKTIVIGRPRLTITIGGEYNGKQTNTAR